MARRHWLRKRRAAQRGTSNNRRRPRFEPLEERRLLAITVNTLVDELDGSIVDGDVSLRDAIAAAPAGETINFHPSLSGATILLTLGELQVTRSLTIDASDLASGLTIDASGNDLTPATNNGDGSRVLRIDDGTATHQNVELRGLTLTGGDVTGTGGGIQNAERLALVGVKLQDNAALGAQGLGGGLWSSGAAELSITTSVISGNVASLDGGGVWARAAGAESIAIAASTISGNSSGLKGGGLYVDAVGSTITISNSTISGNTAGSDGGGAYARTTGGGANRLFQNTISGNAANWRGGGLFAFAADGATTVRFSTITANTADADANNPGIETGGGIFARGGGSLAIDNSIVAANIDPASHAPDLKLDEGALVARYNLIGASGGSGLAPASHLQPDANGNMVGGETLLDPGLAALADNGGPTQTHALSPLSVAVNVGDPALTAGSVNPAQGVFENDQRGSFRFNRGPGRDANLRADIGAFEVAATALNQLEVSTVSDVDDGNTTPGNLSLREAVRIALQVNESVTPTIVFAHTLSGEAITLLNPPLIVDRPLNIDASALAENVRIIRGGTPTALQIHGVDVTLRGLTFIGVNVANDNGGLLQVIDCLIQGGGFDGLTSSRAGLRIVGSTLNAIGGRAINASFMTSLEIVDSSIINCGAGIEHHGHIAMTIRRSLISGNVGFGIFADGANIYQSTLSNNGEYAAKGQSLFKLVDSSVIGNKAGIYAEGASIENSTISGNRGIGIRVIRNKLTVTNSTISNNLGRGIDITSTDQIAHVIRHSTITGNQTTNTGSQGTSGAGIRTRRTITIDHSIVAGNISSTGVEHDLDGAADLFFSILGRDTPNQSNNAVDRGGSLIGTNESPIDPLLGSLADNGGPTLTHALLPGSPAISAGDPALVAGIVPTPNYDQRGDGFVRIADGRIDIGAVEFRSPNNTFPTFTSPTAVSVAENSTAVQTVTAADPDVPPQTLTYSIRGGADAAKFAITPAGVLTFQEGQDYDVPGDANGDRVYVVDVQVQDGVGGVVFQTIEVTVTATNDNHPVFTSPSAASVVENTLPVMPVVAKDADVPVQSVTYSIAGGPDGARFLISATGTLLFADAPDFEAPADANGDNVYEVTVQASDGVGGTTTQNIKVTVTPANDNAPVFTSPSTASVAEGTTAVMAVTATDADLPQQGVMFSLVGGADRAKFVITAGGALSFVAPPDFDAPTDASADNVYEVAVQASDGLRSTQQTILVTVTAVDAYPLPGDFNDDGVVDAADLPVWRSHFGQTAGANNTEGDADGDHDVDGADFLIWQRSLGQTTPPAAAAAVVAAEATEQESAAISAPRSFHLDADIILANPAVPGAPRVGDSPRQRPNFRPPGLPSAQIVPTEIRTCVFASPAAVDAAIAASQSLLPAAESAFAALRPDRVPLDDVFAAVGEF